MHVEYTSKAVFLSCGGFLRADIEAAAFPAKHICRYFQAAAAARRAGQVPKGRGHVATPHRSPLSHAPPPPPTPWAIPLLPLGPSPFTHNLSSSHCPLTCPYYFPLCPSPLVHPLLPPLAPHPPPPPYVPPSIPRPCLILRINQGYFYPCPFTSAYPLLHPWHLSLPPTPDPTLTRADMLQSFDAFISQVYSSSV